MLVSKNEQILHVYFVAKKSGEWPYFLGNFLVRVRLSFNFVST